VDHAGRLFPRVVGVAGPVAAGRAAAPVQAALDAVLYEAVAARLDADGVLARIEAVALVEGNGPGLVLKDAPAASLWWPAMADGDEPAPLRADRIDAALVGRLWDGQGIGQGAGQA
jgi:hypothetical protein